MSNDADIRVFTTLHEIWQDECASVPLKPDGLETRFFMDGFASALAAIYQLHRDHGDSEAGRAGFQYLWAEIRQWMRDYEAARQLGQPCPPPRPLVR